MTPQSPVIPDRPDLQPEETTFGAKQPEFQPLPALCFKNGDVLTRWHLSDEERERFLETGELYILITKALDQPLLPICPSVDLDQLINMAVLPPRPDATEEWPEAIG